MMTTRDLINSGMYYADFVKNDAEKASIKLSDIDIMIAVFAGMINDYHKALVNDLKSQGIEISYIEEVEE